MGLNKDYMPRGGDAMVCKKHTTLGQTSEFAAQIPVLDIPNEIKVGYSLISNWRQENGGSPCFEVQRNGRGKVPVTAAALLRQFLFMNDCAQLMPDSDNFVKYAVGSIRPSQIRQTRPPPSRVQASA